MVRKRTKVQTRKNIGVAPATFRRLETFKAGLIEKMADPNLTYDDVINHLLDASKKFRK